MAARRGGADSEASFAVSGRRGGGPDGSAGGSETAEAPLPLHADAEEALELSGALPARKTGVGLASPRRFASAWCAMQMSVS